MSLLLLFEIQSCHSSYIFLASSFVQQFSFLNLLSYLYCLLSPPVPFKFYEFVYNLFNFLRHAFHCPVNICLVASPGLVQMLKNHFQFVPSQILRQNLFDFITEFRFELHVVISLDSLFSYCLYFRPSKSSFELSLNKVSYPVLQQRRNPSKKTQPNFPQRLPETHPRSFERFFLMKLFVYYVFKVFALSYLMNQLVFVPVHSC